MPGIGHVLLIGPPPVPAGGQSIQATTLLRGFREAGRPASFLAAPPVLRPPWALLQQVRFVRTLANSVVYLARLVRRLPRHDILHVFSASYSAFLLVAAPVLLLGRLFRKKVVLHYHSGEAEDHLGRSPLAVRLCRLADAIVVPSEYLVGVFRRHGLAARAIPNVVELERFAYRRRDVAPFFVATRNLEPLYNVACVLRAFQKIQQEVPEARLAVAGEGSQRGRLQQLARDLALRNVTFLGSVPPDRMPAVYDGSDVFLNASNIDNMPVSILEAFASGLPVVSSNPGGIPYIVNDRVTGLLVPLDDPGRLAAASLELLADPQFARQLAENARDECRRYELVPVTRAWLTLYAELLGQAFGAEDGIEIGASR